MCGIRRREMKMVLVEMFARFWPEPVVRFLMRGYASAYKEYE